MNLNSNNMSSFVSFINSETAVLFLKVSPEGDENMNPKARRMQLMCEAYHLPLWELKPATGDFKHEVYSGCVKQSN